jgi:hypothetical protein
VRFLVAFGLALVLSVAAPASGQIGLIDDLVDTTGDLLDETIQTIGDLDTGIEVVDDTVGTTVGVVDDVVGTVEEPDPEPQPDPEPPRSAEREPATPQPDTRQTEAASDDREAARPGDDAGEADLRSPSVTVEPIDESEDDGFAAATGSDFDVRRTFDIFAADRMLTSATTGPATTLFDRALDWLTSSASLRSVLAGPLIALQVLLRALLSAGSGVVAPASMLAAILAVSLHDRRRPREVTGELARLAHSGRCTAGKLRRPRPRRDHTRTRSHQRRSGTIGTENRAI